MTNDVAANEVNGLTMSRRAECDEQRIQMGDGHERLVWRMQRHLQPGGESEGFTGVSARDASELEARVRRLRALGETFAHVVVRRICWLNVRFLRMSVPGSWVSPRMRDAPPSLVV